MHYSEAIRIPGIQSVASPVPIQQPTVTELPKPVEVQQPISAVLTSQTAEEAMTAPPAQQVVVNNQEILDSIANLSKKVDEGLQLSTAAKSVSDTILTDAEANQILVQMLHYQDKYFPTLPLSEIQCREFISNIPRSVFEAAEHNFGFDNEYDLMNPIFLFYIMCVSDHHNEVMGEFLTIVYDQLHQNKEFIKDMKDEFDNLDDSDNSDDDENGGEDGDSSDVNFQKDDELICEECFRDNDNIVRCSNEECQNYPTDLNTNIGEATPEGVRINPSSETYDEGIPSYNTSVEQSAINADTNKGVSPFPTDTRDVSSLRDEDEFNGKGNYQQRQQGKKKKQQYKQGRNAKGKS